MFIIITEDFNSIKSLRKAIDRPLKRLKKGLYVHVRVGDDKLKSMGQMLFIGFCKQNFTGTQSHQIVYEFYMATFALC